MRTAIGLALGLALIGAIIFATLRENAVECEVCMRYAGREACNASTGADAETAQMQATSSACARIASGVTDSIRCSRTQPASLRCE